MKTMIVIGNIGKIEMKYTPAGKAVTEFSVAVNSKVGGEKVTEWFKCAAWEKSAEIIHEYAAVGSKIFISGSPKVEAWNNKDGEARAQTVITVREFEFLGDKEKKQATNSDPFRPSDGDGWDGSVQE